MSSYRGQGDGPTLNESTAEMGVRVRVLGSSVNRGLCGWIIAGEHGPRPTIEFDNGETRAYDVHRLQLYCPHGFPEYKMGVKPHVPVVNNGQPARKPAQRPHTVVTEPDKPADRRRPKEPAKELDPADKIYREDADWNF